MNSRFSFSPSDRFRGLLPHDPCLLTESAENGESEVPQLPLSLYLPESYEPRHAYPLVVWLHQDGRDESQVHELLPAISNRNYIGLGFRGTSDNGQSREGRYDWDDTDESIDELVCEIRDTLADFQSYFRIDPNRVYLVGIGDGARMSLELLLRSPELFSGAVALSGPIPAARGRGVKFRLLTSRRVLLGRGKQDRAISHERFLNQARDLADTGLQVESRLYEAGPEPDPGTLREIDRWLMARCETSCV
jgi:phospholipase/carboxylesterase